MRGITIVTALLIHNQKRVQNEQTNLSQQSLRKFPFDKENKRVAEGARESYPAIVVGFVFVFCFLSSQGNNNCLTEIRFKRNFTHIDSQICLVQSFSRCILNILVLPSIGYITSRFLFLKLSIGVFSVIFLKSCQRMHQQFMNLRNPFECKVRFGLGKLEVFHTQCTEFMFENNFSVSLCGASSIEIILILLINFLAFENTSYITQNIDLDDDAIRGGQFVQHFVSIC